MTAERVRELLGCFPEGTPIRTIYGHRPIEELKEGEFVLSRSESDPQGEVASKEVVAIYRKTAKIYHLHLQGRLIRTTAEHPFWVKGKGWTATKYLQSADEVMSLGGEWLRIDEVVELQDYETVYNIQIADYHTYFVGEENWGWSLWAHNAGAGGNCNQILHQIGLDRLSGAGGVNVLGENIPYPTRMLPPPPRPSWQMSELEVQSMLSGWNRQQSFINGQPARYGATGSVRPDFSHPTLNMHVDVKNYNLTTAANRRNLYLDVAAQARSRAQNLPSGAVQGIVLDIRGQSIDPAVLQRVPTNIQTATNDIIRAENIRFLR